MVSLLALVVLATVLISALCSLSEAAIYSVPLQYVRHLAAQGVRSGRVLVEFKDDIARPISVILTVNTLSNSLGPMLAGWMLAEISGGSPAAVGAFSIVFALGILLFGEFLPKTAGAVYCRSVARSVALPIHYMTELLGPVLRFSLYVQTLMSSSTNERAVSHEELLSLAELGTEEGALDDLEGEVISNVIGLDKVLVRDVLTPRVVVFRLEEGRRLSELRPEVDTWQFSRIPLYNEDSPETLNAYVTQRDIFSNLLSGNDQLMLREISRPLKTVPELMRVDQLLLRMFEDKEHIVAVVDEHGALAGIVTMEDLLEELLGREIVDEYDAVSDLRSFAKLMRLSKRKARKT